MRAFLSWRLARDRGIALFILASLALTAYSGLKLDRLGAMLYLAALSQGALWGGLALFFVLYRRDVRALARGELGILLLLPQGPLRYVLAQAAEFLMTTGLLFGGLLALAVWTVARFAPEGTGELLRLGLYLFFTAGLPMLGNFQLATAMHAAYFLGRVGGLAAALVIFASSYGLGQLIGQLEAHTLWNWGPKIRIGEFRWLTGSIPGLSILSPSGEWPLWPVLLGVGLFLLYLWLAFLIYRETEL